MTISTTLTKTHTQVGVTNRKDTHSVCVWDGRASIKNPLSGLPTFTPESVRYFVSFSRSQKRFPFSLYISFFLLLLLLLYLRFPFPISFFHFQRLPQLFDSGRKKEKKEILKAPTPSTHGCVRVRVSCVSCIHFCFSAIHTLFSHPRASRFDFIIYSFLGFL
jgi:hypothetical protein